MTRSICILGLLYSFCKAGDFSCWRREPSQQEAFDSKCHELKQQAGAR